HFLVERVLECLRALHGGVGVRVLGLEIRRHLGTVLVAQPGIFVLAALAVDHVRLGHALRERGGRAHRAPIVPPPVSPSAPARTVRKCRSVELKLARSILRPWRVGDEASLVRHANNRRVWRNLSRLPHPYTTADAHAWIARASAQSPVTDFAITVDGEAVGGIGVELGRLEGSRLANPFVLRSVDPPLGDVVGRTVTGVRRLGKRIVLALDAERFVVVHLMIAGRLHWKAVGARPPGRIGVAAFDFTTGTLVMTEAGTKKRAAIHLVRGEAALAEHDPGGREPLTAGLEEFRAA